MRTGTSKTGKIYTYYVCANRMTKGSKACVGTNVSIPALDDLVRAGIEEHLLPPERLLKILQALIARKRQFSANVDGRLETLHAERTKVEATIERALANAAPISEVTPEALRSVVG